jgi:hypothetical protein
MAMARSNTQRARISAGAEGKWPAYEIASQGQEFRRRSKFVPYGESQVAQRAFVGIKAENLSRRRGAGQVETLAEHPAAREIAAEECVEHSKAGAGGEQRCQEPSWNENTKIFSDLAINSENIGDRYSHY